MASKKELLETIRALNVELVRARMDVRLAREKESNALIANQAAVIRNAKLTDENDQLNESLARTVRQLSAIQLIVEG